MNYKVKDLTFAQTKKIATENQTHITKVYFGKSANIVELKELNGIKIGDRYELRMSGDVYHQAVIGLHNDHTSKWSVVTIEQKLVWADMPNKLKSGEYSYSWDGSLSEAGRKYQAKKIAEYGSVVCTDDLKHSTPIKNR